MISVASLRKRFENGRALFLILMVPNMILSILYLAVDVDDPLTISALLVDRVLQITSAIVFPISLVMVLSAPIRIARVGAIIASICSALLGISASVSALRPPIKILPTALAVICAVIGVASLVWLTRKVMLTSRWRFSLIGLLALLPLIQFWHATSFVPARLKTSMGVTSAVVKVHSETKSDRRATVEFELVNGSDVDAVILASRVMWCFRPSNAGIETNMDKLYNDHHCAWGALILHTTVIHGKTSFSYHQAFSAPKDRPFLQLFVKVWFARSDRLRIDPGEVEVDASKTASCSAGHVATYRLLDDAKIKGLVQRAHYITYEGYPTAPVAWLSTEGEPLCGGGQDLIRYFGVTYIQSNQQEWLSMK
jgi:hypothetical protein